jgi:hypothetical protein
MRFIEYISALTPHSRVDREAGIIRDVLILGSRSANGRTYTADAMSAAARLYEGVSVYIDHQPEGRRSYRDKIGWLTAVSFREGALRGDLHINPSHPAAAQLLWDAEHHPAAVGLSHDAEGRVVTRDGQTIVEAIESVRSVDLVAEPATTQSLFEDKSMPSRLCEQDPPAGAPAAPAADPLEALYQSLTLEDLQAKRPDLLDELRKQLQQEIATPMGDLKAQLEALKAKLDEYMAAEQADQQMAEARLDPARVPPRLREAIRRERSPQRRAALIEDVQRLVSQPTSVSTWPIDSSDLKSRLANWRI